MRPLALLLLVSCGGLAARPESGATPFTDDFEHGLGRWETHGEPASVTVAPSGDPAHGNVLVLDPGGEDVYALARGVEGWPAVRIEGDVNFRTDEDNYFAVIYNFQRRQQGGRTDFGDIYIKGNQSYLQVNPHRDFNVGRLLYPEYHVELTGPAAIQTGAWQHFKVEVAGDTCHFTVGPGDTPQLTFSFLELTGGRVGLQPRSVGGPVWVDNVVISRIDRLSYAGPPVPSFPYAPDGLLTRWEVIGPLAAVNDDIGRQPDAPGRAWRPFPADARGGVITMRVTDYRGPRAVAYLRTKISSPSGGKATLRFSSVDNLMLWVNGHFDHFVRGGAAAWYDVASNDAHVFTPLEITLKPGDNDVVVRVRGGVNAAGGFFVSLAPR